MERSNAIQRNTSLQELTDKNRGSIHALHKSEDVQEASEKL
jgi:hypothetical protein